MTWRRMAALAVAVLAPAALAAQATPSPPAGAAPQVFRSAVDLVRVDVQVIGNDGHPMLGLGIDDFDVGIDGSARRVVSAELVQFSPAVDIVNTVRPVRTPGEIPSDSRVYVLAIDLAAFPTGEIQSVRQAVRRFLSQLRPQDLVALYAFPYRTPALDLTHDHSSIAFAVDRLVGLRTDRPGVFHLTPSEIIDITAGDDATLGRVFRRECVGADINDPNCLLAIQTEASSLASYLEAESSERLHALSNLVRRLSVVQGRKTVVLLSGGMINSTRTVGRPDVTSLISAVGAETANSQTSLYVLHWDTSWDDTFSANAPTSRRPADRFRSSFADRDAVGHGLEMFAGKAGGALYRIAGGTGDLVFDRVLRETTAYYLLGVEPTARDRDGRLHFIRVGVKPGGATVRSRTQVVIPVK